jgi:hypothetical protein
LNFLPSTTRINVLEQVYKVYKVIMDANAANERLGALSKQKPLFIETYDYMAVLDHILETLGKTAYRFAIRNYITSNMHYGRVIEYQDFGKCAFIMTQDAIGATIEEIYNQYWEYNIHKPHVNSKLAKQTAKKIKRRTGKDVEKMRVIRNK